MIFLTEEDVRQRCELGQGGEFRLQAGERLTPAATELLRSRGSGRSGRRTGIVPRWNLP